MSLAKLNYGFCTILKKFGEVTIAKLEKDFVSLVNHRFMHPNVLRSFLQKYPQIFEFDTDGAYAATVCIMSK
jgi:hypothetical protein